MKAMPVRWDQAAGKAWMYLPNNELVCTVYRTSRGWAVDDRYGCVVTPVSTRKHAMALAEEYYGVQEIPDAIQWIPASQPPPMADHGALRCSADVLVTDGRQIKVGWLMQDVDDPAHPAPWWSRGEDSDYRFGDVTHWAPLPALP